MSEETNHNEEEGYHPAVLNHPTMYECPGCGCDPEMVVAYRDVKTKVRVGYRCSCGTVVINGIVQNIVPVLGA